MRHNRSIFIPYLHVKYSHTRYVLETMRKSYHRFEVSKSMTIK
jgi:hypothetical protein